MYLSPFCRRNLEHTDMQACSNCQSLRRGRH
jgi:hypothetical protein